jgi:hypothetical protein
VRVGVDYRLHSGLDRRTRRCAGLRVRECAPRPVLTRDGVPMVAKKPLTKQKSGSRHQENAPASRRAPRCGRARAARPSIVRPRSRPARDTHKLEARRPRGPGNSAGVLTLENSGCNEMWRLNADLPPPPAGSALELHAAGLGRPAAGGSAQRARPVPSNSTRGAGGSACFTLSVSFPRGGDGAGRARARAAAPMGWRS